MSQTPREHHTDWRARDDAQVFVALERARGLCARLGRLPDGPPPGREALAAAETELGLAGFLACEHLDAGQRDALRDEARGAAAAGGADLLADELLALVTSAGRLAHDTQDPAVCEELHVAGLHIDDALRLLAARASGRRVAWSGW